MSMIPWQLLILQESIDSHIERLQLFYRSLYEVRDDEYISNAENKSNEIIFQFEMNGVKYYILKDDYNAKILAQENYQEYIDWHKNKINTNYEKIIEIEKEIEDTQEKIRAGIT